MLICIVYCWANSSVVFVVSINATILNTPTPNRNLTSFDQIGAQLKNTQDERKFDNLIPNAFPESPIEPEHSKKGSLYEKFMDFSKVVFSRESTYRGFVDIFAEDLPNIVADAFRGKAAFLEAIFKSFETTGYIFSVPWVLKQISHLSFSNVFPQLDKSQIDKLMLFSLADLENKETFNQAKQRILKEEINDSDSRSQVYQGHAAIENNLNELKSFMNNFNPDDKFVKSIYDLKKNIFMKLSCYTSFIGTLFPILKRLFRKYVLGVDRFVGSMKYLNDKNADKLGNVKGFSAKQILMNITSLLSIPAAFSGFMNFDKSTIFKPIFDKLKSKIDTRHSYHPKTGLFVPISSLPYLIGKMVNSQDRFEAFENFTRFTVSVVSLFFGDRATNGVFAKAADKKLSEKHGVEPGILYYKDQEGASIGGLLAGLLPEAAKFNHVLDKTKGNKPLQEEATDLYRKIFYKGFFFHSLGTFLLKLFINWTTKARVSNALAKA